MKKYFNYLIFTSIIIGMVLAFNLNVASATEVAKPTSISQLIELLISLGVIPTNKVTAARAMIAQLNSPALATSTSYLQVISPNGGESWEMDFDTPYVITWGSAGFTYVHVALIPAKGASCELNILPTASKDGAHSLNVWLKTALCYNLITGTSTPLTNGTYKVRVYYTDTAGVTIKDESNSTFKIIPKPIPSLKVVYPNGGESLVSNSKYVIKYSVLNVESSMDDLLYYYLLDNTGNIILNGHKLLNKGTFDLSLPYSLSAGAYKIKLSFTTNKRVVLEDTSDNFFWITAK